MILNLELVMPGNLASNVEWQRSCPSPLPAALSKSTPDKGYPGPGKHRGWLDGSVFLIWVIPAACFVLAGRQTGRTEQSGASGAPGLLLNTPGICSRNLRKHGSLCGCWLYHELKLRPFPRALLMKGNRHLAFPSALWMILVQEEFLMMGS